MTNEFSNAGANILFHWSESKFVTIHEYSIIFKKRKRGNNRVNNDREHGDNGIQNGNDKEDGDEDVQSLDSNDDKDSAGQQSTSKEEDDSAGQQSTSEEEEDENAREEDEEEDPSILEV